jgi:methylated-DNA-protein-cysteine methyltransferase-like protein
MITSFRDKVYVFTRKIPKGKVVTYGQLAKLAGNPKAARAIGTFMRMNPDAPHTPCHRVVAADGSLTGYSGNGGIKKKKEMLIAEGVSFKNEKVDLAVSKWESNFSPN